MTELKEFLMRPNMRYFARLIFYLIVFAFIVGDITIEGMVASCSMVILYAIGEIVERLDAIKGGGLE